MGGSYHPHLSPCSYLHIYSKSSAPACLSAKCRHRMDEGAFGALFFLLLLPSLIFLHPSALSFGLSETIVYRDLQIVLFLLSHKQSEAKIHHPFVRLFCMHKGAINFCKVSPLRRHRTLYCPIQYEILCGGFEYKKCTRKSATGGGREEGRADGRGRTHASLTAMTANFLVGRRHRSMVSLHR